MQTGPVTAQGKAASSINATRHGLTSSKVVLPGEDTAAFERLFHLLKREHRPVTTTESLLVQEMAQAHWRLDRVRRRQDQEMMAETLDTTLLALLHRYATSYERSFFKSLQTLKKLQQEPAKTSRPTFVSQKAGQATAPPRHPYHETEDCLKLSTHRSQVGSSNASNLL